MKLFSIVVALVSVTLASAATTSSDKSPASSLTGAVDEFNCYWSGTAPFCAGSCGPPTIECGTSSCGDGACCITGYKKYCCYDATCPTTKDLKAYDNASV